MHDAKLGALGGRLFEKSPGRIHTEGDTGNRIAFTCYLQSVVGDVIEPGYLQFAVEPT